MIKRPYGYWRVKENRINETRQLVRRLSRKPDDLRAKDFTDNRMAELLKKAGGMNAALVEAGFKVRPHTIRPSGYWKVRQNRITAIRHIVRKLGKDVSEITQNDFFTNESSQLLSYYNCSPWEALHDAGYQIRPWEMKRFPITIWKSESNRIEAVKWLVNKVGKRPKDILYDDFMKHRIGGLLLISKGVPNTLKEAGFNVKRRWVPRNYWKKRKNRIKHIKELVRITGKLAEEITYHDFATNGLYQLLEYYRCSAIAALIDAGYTLRPEVIKQRTCVNGKKMYTSKHGHRFRSIFEKDLDNWFHDHGIRMHRHDVPYPESKMSCDFVIGDYWIEAVGLGGRQSYLKQIERKKTVAKKHRIKLICISYDDFYRPYVLERKLSGVLRKHGRNYNDDLMNYTNEDRREDERC